MYQILLAEDDSTLRYMYARMKAWKENGFRIAEEAENGREALKKLEQDRFDLVVTDIRMPFMDGLELLREMRSRGIGTPVILISSYGEFEYARQGMVLGALDYIVKPFRNQDLSEVLGRVAEQLSQRGEGDKHFALVQSVFAAEGIAVGDGGFARRLCSYFAAHIGSTITMEEAAAHLELSKDYFGKSCKQHLGMSFGAIHAKVRIAYSQMLLRESSFKIYEISEMLGYATTDYFTKVFKAETGMTPSQYRAKM